MHAISCFVIEAKSAYEEEVTKWSRPGRPKFAHSDEEFNLALERCDELVQVCRQTVFEGYSIKVLTATATDENKAEALTRIAADLSEVEAKAFLKGHWDELSKVAPTSFGPDGPSVVPAEVAGVGVLVPRAGPPPAKAPPRSPRKTAPTAAKASAAPAKKSAVAAKAGKSGKP